MFGCEQSISPDLAGINEWKHSEHAEQSIITNRAFDSETLEKMVSFFIGYNILYTIFVLFLSARGWYAAGAHTSCTPLLRVLMHIFRTLVQHHGDSGISIVTTSPVVVTRERLLRDSLWNANILCMLVS